MRAMFLRALPMSLWKKLYNIYMALAVREPLLIQFSTMLAALVSNKNTMLAASTAINRGARQSHIRVVF